MTTRVEEIQKIMNQKNLDVCVLRLPENVVLLSEYWPRNGFSFVFIPKNGKPSLIVPHGDINDPNTGTISDIRKFAWIKINSGNPFENISKHIRELVEEGGIEEVKKIGVDSGYDTIAPALCSGEVNLIGGATESMLQNIFKGCSLISIKDEIASLRVIKKETDINKLQIVNELGISGLKYFQNLVRHPHVGMREIDLAAMTEAYIARKACAYKGMKFGRAWAQVSSGLRTADEAWFAGVISGERIIKNGDFVMLEMGMVVDGYWCDLTMTEVVGEKSKQQIEIIDSVKRAQKLAIQAIKPGVAAKEVDRIARASIEADGYGDYFIHATGHGVGFAYHESLPMLHPDSNDVLQSGMVHSCEPGVYIPGVGGVRFEANILVTEDGGVVLGE